MKCQPWCLAGSVSEGRRELAALALHRMSEALRNFLLSRSPSCLEPTPGFVLGLASLERCLAVLQLSGQQTHQVSACSRLWNSSAGWGWVVSVGARNTDPEGHEAPGKMALFRSVLSVAVPAICVGSWH